MASASENAATVVNSGRDDAACIFNDGTFFGTGSATFVTNNGGNVLYRCAGSLDDASPTPNSAQKIEGSGPFGTTCQITVTPGGRFSAVCK